MGPGGPARSGLVLVFLCDSSSTVLEAIEKLPADATLEDAIERLVLLAKIERGLAQLDAGRGSTMTRQSVGVSGDSGHLGTAGH